MSCTHFTQQRVLFFFILLQYPDTACPTENYLAWLRLSNIGNIDGNIFHCAIVSVAVYQIFFFPPSGAQSDPHKVLSGTHHAMGFSLEFLRWRYCTGKSEKGYSVHSLHSHLTARPCRSFLCLNFWPPVGRCFQNPKSFSSIMHRVCPVSAVPPAPFH